MYILTNEEMRAIDRRAITVWEIPSAVLMESAGLAVVEQLFRDFPDIRKQRVTVLAGSGNNGGDGLVIARHLYMRKVPVSVLVITEAASPSEDHALNRKILNHMPVRVFDISKGQQIKLLKATLNHSDLVIDCLFGTGLNRTLSPFFKDAIETVNAQEQITLLSVDCPSGLDADTGKPWGAAIQAGKTYTLAWPKCGFYMPGAERYTGALTTLPIGIPKEAADMEKPQLRLLTQENLSDYMAPRSADSHKGQYGHVGIIAGSLGMSGAGVLTARATLQSGAGLVTMLVDKAIYTAVASQLPEAMVRPTAWPNPQALDWLMSQCPVLVAGPGMGTTEEKKQILQHVLAHYDGTLLLDADALTLLAQSTDKPLTTCKANVILTPHPGEMGRLVSTAASEVQGDRLSAARDYAREHECVVVLKGHHTIIADSSGQACINACDSEALATAGSGDVLAGCIAALAAQGKSSFDAACGGVLLHGLAGRYSACHNSVRGTIARHIIEGIEAVLLQCESETAQLQIPLKGSKNE